jgi:hypothetical protein
MENDAKGFCEPKLDASYLTEVQLQKLQTARLPKDKWSEIFATISDGFFPEWLEDETSVKSHVSAEATAKPDQVLLQLQSPKVAEQKTGIFDIFPSLSYEDESVGDKSNEDEPDPMDEISQSMKEFKHRFSRIKEKWTSALQDIEVSHLLVTSDIDRLGKMVQDQLGTATPLNGTVFANVWEALTHVASTLQQGLHGAHDSIRNLTDKVEEIMTNQIVWQSDTEAKISGIRDTQKRHEARFGKIPPMLLMLQRTGVPAPPAADISAIQDQLTALTDSVTALQETQWNAGISTTPHGSGSTLEAEVRDLKAQLQLLQVRIVGNGVQIGGIIFQCFNGVRS